MTQCGETSPHKSSIMTCRYIKHQDKPVNIELLQAMHSSFSPHSIRQMIGITQIQVIKAQQTDAHTK